MASGPDLFVVCKNCGSEVSPYITECPYCGTRLRKRAPKLEKGGTPKPPKPSRRPSVPSLGKLRPGEIPGIRADLSLRPYATMALVLIPALVTVGVTAGIPPMVDLFLGPYTGDAAWRLLLASFFYARTGYEVIALVAIGIFGWRLERRYGFWAPLLVYALATVAGAAAAALLDASPLPIGGNAGALGLFAAFAVPVLREHRREGEDSEVDVYGLAAFGAVLLALPLATEFASPVAGIAGLVVGALVGLILGRVRRRD